MVKEAEANAGEDKKKKELVEAKNQADGLIHSTEKNLKDYGDKVQASDKSAIEGAIAELKTAMEGDDAANITAKTEALMQSAMKLGEAVYKASQEEAAQTAASGGPDGDGQKTGTDDSTVVDAEFEEVDPDKKRN
jgi:molecular chaperone DnaK